MIFVGDCSSCLRALFHIVFGHFEEKMKQQPISTKTEEQKLELVSRRNIMSETFNKVFDSIQNEIEALEAIYSNSELEVLENEPFHKFQITISTEEYDSEDNGLTCKLAFTYQEKYPDVGPLVEIDEANYEDEKILSDLLSDIKKNIDENVGMEMIFTLVCAAQEFLNQQWDDLKKQREDELDRLKMQQEEAERKKFEGTRVTVDSFLMWRSQFEIETGITAKKEKAALLAKKLTGKELFLRDTTLNESDIKFLLEAGDSIENVKIDESLFQNIDDLQLDSEDDGNDLDYDPDC